MKFRSSVLVLIVAVGALAAVALATDPVQLSVDTFTEEQPYLVLISSGQNETTASFATGNPDDILGGERDLFMEVSGDVSPNFVFAAGVSGGYFSYSSPQVDGDTSIVQVTWDGEDGSPEVDPSGLGGVELGGPDSVLVLSYTSDYDGEATFEIYSGSLDNYCSAEVSMPHTVDATLLSVPLSSFESVGSGCDFSNVGAVNIVFPMAWFIDVMIDYIRVDVSAPTTTCGVSLYSGGEVCTPAGMNECISCDVEAVHYSFRFQCGPSNGTECSCTQQEFLNSDCSGTPLQSNVPTQSCGALAGLAPVGTVCFPFAEPNVEYRVNFLHSDPGVVEESCTEVGGANATCMACTAGGLTNYYTAVCDASATPPCVLEEYSESTCSTPAVKLAMNELTCGQLHEKFAGEMACAFSYEVVPS